jgi:8-oxo-dGTP pyrophosphatase MutT (NUDIX family)
LGFVANLNLSLSLNLMLLDLNMNACGKYFIDKIRDSLNRRERKVIEHPPFPRAAVLVPLFEKEGSCRLLFTMRSQQVKHHKGQISFPGGALDDEDADLRRTALREAFEEIGLKEREVQILGILDDIVTTSEFIVTPFVGVFPYPYPFQVSPIEIAELVEVPLASLLDSSCFGEREVIDNGLKRVVESYQYEHHTIWGATARILKQFLDLITSPEPT